MLRRMRAPTPLLLLPLASCAAAGPPPDGRDTAVSTVLDSLHHAAAVADGELYWSLFSPDAVFVGTDESERWTLSEFRAYADRYFERDSAWVYVPTERHVTFSPRGDVAWFDEKLDSASYGAARGSGVLLMRGGQWQIAHYVLSFPIPNDLAKEVTDRIRSFE